MCRRDSTVEERGVGVPVFAAGMAGRNGRRQFICQPAWPISERSTFYF